MPVFWEFRGEVAPIGTNGDFSTTPGTYTYTVKLLPRSTGSYTLNPPRAEPMYQPTLFGRGEMKRVRVR